MTKFVLFQFTGRLDLISLLKKKKKGEEKHT